MMNVPIKLGRAFSSAIAAAVLAAAGPLGVMPALGAQADRAAGQCSPTALTIANVNLRSGPSTGYPVLLTIPFGSAVPITARNADRTWYQVVYQGQQGWSSAQYLRTSCADAVPVIGGMPAPTPTPAPPPAPAVSFSTSARTVNIGQCAILSWNANTSNPVYLGTGAMQVAVPSAGSTQVCPVLSTRYYVRIEATSGSQYYPLEITVVNAQNPANFRSNAYVVNPGQCPTLAWNIDNVYGVYLYLNSPSPQGVSGNATQQVCVASPSNYALKVIYNNGREVVIPMAINVLNQAPGNIVFIATPTAIQPGQCANLEWLVGNARSVYLLDSSTGSRSLVGPTGNIAVCPLVSAVYTIQATLANNQTVQRTQTISVAGSAPLSEVPPPSERTP